MTCWASSLGNCGGGPSREHIISKSQFDEDSITMHGLPWCKEPKTVGFASLVAKNLCADHNHALSPVDNEMRRFKEALKTIMRSPKLPVRVELDARLIERWLLKTTINIALQNTGSGLDVTPDLVRIAYGQATPPPRQGFFLIAELGESVTYQNGIRFESIVRREDGRMVIGAFVLHSVRALYAFEGAPAVKGAMRTKKFNAGVHWLKFRWEPPFDPDDNVMRSS